MNNRWSDVIVFTVLVFAGALTRLMLQDLPNFTPVAAIALFAGYYFRSARVAVLVPLCIMLITDSVIGFYQPKLMFTVYAMLAAPVLARGFLRRWFRLDAQQSAAAWGSFLGLVGSSLAASVAFFLVTNFMCWQPQNGYSADLAGLMQCYAQALPFFKNTITGDLVFSLLLFGAYGLCARRLEAAAMPGFIGQRARVMA